jgi:hypothetical protein
VAVNRPDVDSFSATVAEIQGLYGAFSFPEKLLQKIWLRGNFDRVRATTTAGRRVRVLHPGKWNLLGGPDFRGARLQFDDGPVVTGDVELHLRASDWDAHRHRGDPAYNDVVLHVVLFPPEAGRMTRGAGGRDIPVLALLPLLHHDLEEFAVDEAVEALSHRAASRIPDELGTLPPEDLLALLRRHAGVRWQQKVRFARLRLQRLGWEAACHQTALEILGYRFNRAPMLRLAGEWPLERWTGAAMGAEELFASEAEGWSLQGVRPANHPRVRLRQYAAWTAARPDWPRQLAALATALPCIQSFVTTREVRHRHHLGELRDRLGIEVVAGAIGGTRLDNLICDGFLPLMAARTETGGLDPVWFHWYCGDLPPLVTGGLRQLGVFDRRTQPACHGVAQGLLGWLLETEARQ